MGSSSAPIGPEAKEGEIVKAEEYAEQIVRLFDDPDFCGGEDMDPLRRHVLIAIQSAEREKWNEAVERCAKFVEGMPLPSMRFYADNIRLIKESYDRS